MAGPGSPSPADGTDAIIVSYNTRALLRASLTSLLAQRPRAVIVVDNDSADGSADMVDAEFPTVTLLRNAENVGFASAVNQGLRAADASFVLLLNPDAIMAPGSLSCMTEFMLANPRVGAVGPLMRHPDGRLRVMPAGRQPTLWRVFTHATGLSRLSAFSSVFDGWHHLVGIHDRAPLAVGWLTGGCLLIRTEAIHEVGSLSERWFMYAEDLEFCKRLTDAGWRVVHVPSAVVDHRFGSSAPDAVPVDTRWVESIKDYYRSQWSPSPITDLAWRVTLAAGFSVRSLGYSLVALLRASDRSSWHRESVKYAAYARAAVGSSPERIRVGRPRAPGVRRGDGG